MYKTTAYSPVPMLELSMEQLTPGQQIAFYITFISKPSANCWIEGKCKSGYKIRFYKDASDHSSQLYQIRGVRADSVIPELLEQISKFITDASFGKHKLV